MAEQKTKQTEASVEDFLNAVADASRRSDCFTLLGLMQKATKKAPKMWGTSMIGFGNVHYRYASGREGDTFVMGFSPRKSALTIYGANIQEQPALLKRLGKHKTGKGCLYIRSLDEVDLKVLTTLLQQAAAKKN